MEAGGNLVVFPGPNTDVQQWKQNSVWQDLLPVTLAPAQQAAGDSGAIGWKTTDFEHPVSAPWNDSREGSLGGLRVTQYFPLTLREPDGTVGPNVIARLADNQPAAVEWRRGRGTVVIFNGPATTEWSNLPLHPAFVPLMQRLLGYLTRPDEALLALSPGEPFVKEVPAAWRGRDFFVQGPNESTPRQAGQIQADGDRTFIRFADTNMAGPYRLFVDGQAAAAFAVQLDPRESDLRQLPAADLEVLSPKPESGAVPAPMKMVVTREFWFALLVASVLLYLLQTALAHRFSQSR